MKKINPRKTGSLIRKVFRLFGMNRDFEEPLSDREEIVYVGIPIDNYYNYHNNRKEIKTALLEAERRKAEAMECQKRRFIC